MTADMQDAIFSNTHKAIRLHLLSLTEARRRFRINLAK
jgi:hypothetical protein